jgi:hypothetical protein
MNTPFRSPVFPKNAVLDASRNRNRIKGQLAVAKA